MTDLFIDYSPISLIVDYHPTDVYAPLLIPAVPGVTGPRGDDGWMVPVQVITPTGPSLVLDYELGKHIKILLNQHITSVVFEGWPPPGFLARMTIEIHNPDDFEIAWPADVKWSKDVAGAVTINESWRAFTTSTGGARINGHVLGNEYPL